MYRAPRRTDDDWRKTNQCGRAHRAGKAAGRGLAGRANCSAICRFVCCGAWTACFASARFALSRFARTAEARGVAGGDGTGAGNHVRGASTCWEGEAAADVAKGWRGVPQEISGGADAATKMERG